MTLAAKPRSMPSGVRNVLRSNDSASLWNCSLSPGWTRNDAETLSKALIRFGIGNWKLIQDSGVLPGKTTAQLNLQTQRLLGQQSTAEFAGLHIDPNKIREINQDRVDVKRKNGCIINTGGKISREDLKRKVAENKERYEAPEDEWENIVFDSIKENGDQNSREHVEEEDTDKTKQRELLIQKRTQLIELQKQLEKVNSDIELMKSNKLTNEMDESGDDDDDEYVESNKKAKLG